MGLGLLQFFYNLLELSFCRIGVESQRNSSIKSSCNLSVRRGIIVGMKLKKPIVAPMPSVTTTSGVTIADRFKLDAEEPKKSRSGTNKVAATIALIAAVVALALAGGLVYVLYGHLEFLSQI